MLLQQRGPYRIVRTIGSGATGTVYEAIDPESGARVAVKVLTRMDGASLLRFKREFRSLADLVHRNLVRLYHLGEDDGLWFFSMEFVDGVDLAQYCRCKKGGDASTADQEGATGQEKDREVGDVPVLRLIRSLRQLSLGLSSLHAHGKIHRDIKPSNILVSRAGRVVLVDFGLVRDMGLHRSERLTEPGLAGTVAYMAPEVISEANVTPAADWYSVGVVIYQLLTGRLPFEGSAMDIMFAKQGELPQYPGAVKSSCDPKLADLCMELLHPDPGRRPSGETVMERIGVKDPRRVLVDLMPSVSVALDSFVGRGPELDRMDQRWSAVLAGRPSVFLVRGESGVGKSVLVERFLDRARDRGGALVLPSKCHERETVAYQAFDAVMDRISVELQRMERAGHSMPLPKYFDELAKVFPVLGRAGGSIDIFAPSGERDPAESKKRAFVAFTGLLQRLAVLRPLVIFLDDVQWADGDSLRLLDALVGGFGGEAAAGYRIMVVLSQRGTRDRPALEEIKELGLVDELDLAPLTRKQSRLLAERMLLAGASGSVQPSWLERIAVESRGNPFFVVEMVRHVQYRVGEGLPIDEVRLNLTEVLRQRFQSLSDSARRVLEMTAVAESAIPQDVLSRATGLPLSDDTWIQTLSMLRARRLIRCRGFHSNDMVEIYHNRIRESLLEELDEGQVRDHHRRLASAMEGRRGIPEDVLGRHWHAGGEPQRARTFILDAARDAADKLAFRRAADLYRQAAAIEHNVQDEYDLQMALGSALVSDGQVAAAADAFTRAAKAAPDKASSLKARYLAADQFLKGGYVVKGLAGIRDVLRAVGFSLPGVGLPTLLAIGWQTIALRLRGLKFSRRDSAETPERERMALEVLWSAAVGLGIVDPILSVLFQSQFMRLALDLGDESKTATAFAMKAAQISARGSGFLGKSRMLVTRSEALARSSGDQRAIGRVLLSRSIIEYFSGNWEASLRMGEQAERHFEDHCAGVGWELASTKTFIGFSLMMLGRMHDLNERVFRHLAEARNAGDRFLEANMRLNRGIAWIASDRVQEAEREIEHLLDPWPADRVQLQHTYRVVALGEFKLYEGKWEEAWRFVQEQKEALQGRTSMHLMIGRARSARLLGRAALAMAAISQNRAERKRFARHALRQASKLRREKLPFTDAWAAHLEAGAAWQLTGDVVGTISALDSAIGSLDSCALELDALAARRRRAELTGDQNAVEEVDARIRQTGVVRPKRFVRMVSPGLEPSS